ncbi:MAG: hypothetical protein ACYDDU_17790 [Dermatophilaceae bacterium]
MIAPTRLRRGGINSARSAARLVADALVTAKACGGRGSNDESLEAIIGPLEVEARASGIK